MNGWDFAGLVLGLAVIVGLVIFLALMFKGQLRSFKIKILGNEVSAELDPRPVSYGPELVEPVVVVGEAAALQVDTHVEAEGVVLTDEVHLSDDITVEKTEESIAEDVRRSEEIRRAQFEVVIDEAARWGWDMAHLQAFSSFPHPVVVWDEAGKPTIAFGSTDKARMENVKAMAAEASGYVGGRGSASAAPNNSDS